MNSFILFLVLQSWCAGFINSEYDLNVHITDNEEYVETIKHEFYPRYGTPESPEKNSIHDVIGDYESCIETATESEIFNYIYFTGHPDVRI
jgi:hypothetical protein